jgi:hypothetical protein
MNHIATIQIYHQRQWHDAATIRSDTNLSTYSICPTGQPLY